MNIIRSTAVELSEIPAIAYKQKLASGGAGIRILRLDTDAKGIFTIDKRTGQAVPFGTVDEKLFPEAAVDEALELTVGLPYSSRGKIKVSSFEEDVREEEDVTPEQPEAADMVDSEEYNAIVWRYSNEKGRINYPLMNKDFIQFASGSKIVADMVENKANEDTILIYIVQNRAALLAGRKDALSQADTISLIESLDEIDPRSAFKELKAYIRRMLARR
jgi:hypothetical protein